MKPVHIILSRLFISLVFLSFPAYSLELLLLAQSSWQNEFHSIESEKDRKRAIEELHDAIMQTGTEPAYQTSSPLTSYQFATYPALELSKPGYARQNFIMSYEWIDLDADDNKELIIVTDASGRGFPQLNIFFRLQKGISLQEFTLDNVYIDNYFQDIDNDGIQEVLVENRLGAYWPRDERPAVFLHIFSLHNRIYRESTNLHAEYVTKTFLPEIHQEIDLLKSQMQPDANAHKKISNFQKRELATHRLTELYAKLNTTGQVVDALPLATEWLESKDSKLKSYSLEILKMLNDPKALVLLSRLANDSDRHIAESARIILNRKRENTSKP